MFPGLYRAQKALQFLNPEMVLPEEEADRYVYEILGMKPFYAPYPRRAWVRQVADAGYPFYVVSRAGLGKELTVTDFGEGDFDSLRRRRNLGGSWFFHAPRHDNFPQIPQFLTHAERIQTQIGKLGVLGDRVSGA